MSAQAPPVRYDPDLVEAAVLRAIEERPPAERAWFHRDRSHLYDIADPDDRDRAFARLHGRWLRRLRLHEPVECALLERPLLGRRADGCLLARARVRREEAADLFVRDGRSTVVVRVRPESLVDPERLLPFLRRQFLHVADLLDPPFGYDRTSPASAAGPVHNEALRDRYRVVWETTVDGRLCREGRLPPGAREARRAEFLRRLPLAAPDAEAAFTRWFDDTHPTHAGILAFVAGPAGSGVAAAGNGRCPICRFPSARRELVALRLPPAALRAVQAARPDWRPEQGACRQCVDLYEARYGAQPDVVLRARAGAPAAAPHVRMAAASDAQLEAPRSGRVPEERHRPSYGDIFLRKTPEIGLD